MSVSDRAMTSLASSRGGSVQAKSTSDLTQAIRSLVPDEQAAVDRRIIQRANTAINVGFVPDWSPQERLEVIDEYRKALRGYPLWAVDQAFDSAPREISRRPTPGEVFILCKRAVKPITDEIARRERDATARADAERAANAARCPKEAAAEIMERYGFAKPKRMTDGPVRQDVTPEEVAEWKADQHRRAAQ